MKAKSRWIYDDAYKSTLAKINRFLFVFYHSTLLYAVI